MGGLFGTFARTSSGEFLRKSSSIIFTTLICKHNAFLACPANKKKKKVAESRMPLTAIADAMRILAAHLEQCKQNGKPAPWVREKKGERAKKKKNPGLGTHACTYIFCEQKIRLEKFAFCSNYKSR